MIYLAFGRRELGKTTLSMWMAGRVERRMVFDPRGLLQLGTTVTTRETLAGAYTELVDGDRAELVFTPRGSVHDGFALFAWYARRWVERFPRRPLAVVVDEAAFVKAAQSSEDFLWVLRCSRRECTHVWLTAHRPVDVITDIRSIADYWLLFTARQEHDLAVIAERCGVRVASIVERLKARQWVAWDDARGDDGTAPAVYRAPETWHVALDDARAWRTHTRASGPLVSFPVLSPAKEIDVLNFLQ